MPVEAREDEVILGLCDWDRRTIYLNKDLLDKPIPIRKHKQRKKFTAEVIAHETIHELNPSMREKRVDATAAAVVDRLFRMGFLKNGNRT